MWVVDVVFYLLIGYVDWVECDEFDVVDVGWMISIMLILVDYCVSNGCGLMCVYVMDVKGNYVSFVYFGGYFGWVKKLLLFGEFKCVLGRLD